MPDSQVLGEVGQADAVTKHWFREERLHIAARCLGAAQRLLEEAKEWVAEREAFGRKLLRAPGASASCWPTRPPSSTPRA